MYRLILALLLVVLIIMRNESYAENNKPWTAERIKKELLTDPTFIAAAQEAINTSTSNTNNIGMKEGTCESKEYYSEWYLHQEVNCNNYVVEFISDPPGAKIEVENNYVGQTPCTLKFNGKYATNHVRYINAYPLENGQFVQRKAFQVGEFYPRKVYFNMNIGPVSPAVDVNINKGS